MSHLVICVKCGKSRTLTEAEDILIQENLIELDKIKLKCECSEESKKKTVERENEELKQQIQDLQRENKALKSINQSLDWQSDFDKLKVNYQWGKFKYYTEKLNELIAEMKEKVNDDEEENEYELFIKEKQNG
jgi:hypothetical protein